MKAFATIAATCLAALLQAQEFTLHLDAPAHAGQQVVLYRHADLFTPRTERLAVTTLDGEGRARLGGTVDGTRKLQLRIGDVSGDLYVRPGSTLNVHFPKPGPRTVRTVGGTARVDLEFRDVDALDINALLADLNMRLDGFIAEDLATDEVAGMQALEVVRKGEAQPVDTARRPATLFLTPTWSAARVDSFERKLRRFYAGIDDPWFMHDLDYGMAGLRQGPRAVERELYTAYLKDRPVLYDVPEYVRFVRSFFADELAAHVYPGHRPALERALSATDTDSLKALFAKREFLADDRLCELVMMDQLYLNYHSKLVKRAAVERVLEKLASGSAHPEHRTLAANMLWDLTAMRAGTPLPALAVEDRRGRAVRLDSLLEGATCVAITASWCTYCEVELAGLQQLHDAYKDVIPIIVISLDASREDLDRYLKGHPCASLPGCGPATSCSCGNSCASAACPPSSC